MPKINIYEADNTGSTYLGDEIVVFLPGNCTITADKKDANGCVTIPERANVSDYITAASTKPDGSYEYAKMLTERAFQVVYYNTSAIKQDLFESSWLKDKNQYNIKYLTTGCLGAYDPSAKGDVDLSVVDAMTDLAYARKDCIALIDAQPNKAKAYTDLTTALLGMKDSTDGLQASYAAAFADWGNVSASLVMPGSYFYLDALGAAVNNGQKWDSVAGVKRGVVSSYMKPATMALTKYDLDENVMAVPSGDTATRSFNGIVNVRPYGYTIWGDRTLRKNTSAGLKATSFLSIRVLVCDICKRVYNAAINNTFESNSDVTWANYKTLISELLDQMVADYKLADYKIIKLTSDRASQIKCQIRLVPLEPVEDFDIYIQLENATANITEG